MDRRARTALIGAAGCAAALVVVWLLAVATPFTRWLDDATLRGFAGLGGSRAEHLWYRIASLCDTREFAILAACLVVVAALRRLPRLALAVVVILAGANITTQFLKPALAHTRVVEVYSWPQFFTDSWPSGHSTAAMSLALCAVLVAPSRLRPIVAPIGAAFALGVGYAVIALVSHYPSDVFGGYLVAAMWTMLGIAGLAAADARWPARSGRAAALRLREAMAPTGLGVLAALAVAATVAVTHPAQTDAYLREHTAFAFAALAIGLLAASLPAAVAVLSQGRPAGPEAPARAVPRGS